MARIVSDDVLAETREVSPLAALANRGMLAEGTLVMAGPTLGPVNTGIAVIEAPDEETARTIMEEDPAIAGGFARGELRPFRLSLLRGRD